MPYPTFLSLAEGDLRREREAQDAKWGEQNHPDGTGDSHAALVAEHAKVMCQAADEDGRTTWKHVLWEEVAEAFAESNEKALRTELIQVAAVAIAWVEAIDRRKANVAYVEHPPYPAPLPESIARIAGAWEDPEVTRDESK